MLTLVLSVSLLAYGLVALLAVAAVGVAVTWHLAQLVWPAGMRGDVE